MGHLSSYFDYGLSKLALSGKIACLAALGAFLSSAPTWAQAAKKAAPQSAWVKLCETAKLQKPRTDPKAKPEIITKKICLTHHERLDGNSGVVVVSAAIRDVEGDKKRRLMIMVPLGMMIPAGVLAKIDDAKEPIKLRFSLCHSGGCTAETEATDAIIKAMIKGNQMLVRAINATGRPFFAPVPLNGFSKTLKGKPIDNKQYAMARRNLMVEIRKRQIARYEAAKKAKAAAAPKK